MAGVVFYGNFFGYFEFVEDELFRTRGRTRSEIFEVFDVWLPRVEVHAEFLKPARYGHEIEIRARIAAVPGEELSARFRGDRRWHR